MANPTRAAASRSPLATDRKQVEELTQGPEGPEAAPYAGDPDVEGR